jgi:hypothetical protein
MQHTLSTTRERREREQRCLERILQIARQQRIAAKRQPRQPGIDPLGATFLMKTTRKTAADELKHGWVQTLGDIRDYLQQQPFSPVTQPVRFEP